MDCFPIIFTERLKLRKLEFEDFPLLIKYANNKNISNRIVNIPYPYREPDATFRLGFISKGFKEQTRFVFAITFRETNMFLGEISVHVIDPSSNHLQLAYWIGEPHWKKGIATEAAQALINFGFNTLNAELIFATCNDDNPASQKVLTKSGMKPRKIQ